MAIVALSWLALKLAPADHHGLWVAAAVAAYSMPAAMGRVVFGRFMRGLSGARLAGWDATLRAAALAAIPALYALGVLNIALYTALLAVSSLLHAWGSAGMFMLITELLPHEHQLTGNAVIGVISDIAIVAGPVLAGVVIAWSNAATVLGIDAGTFAVLAVTCRLIFAGHRGTPAPDLKPAVRSGFRVMLRRPELVSLLMLSAGLALCVGPVFVALPLRLADAHAPAGLLSTFYTVFGIGSVAGGFLVPHLRRWPLWPSMLGIVTAMGCALLPLGLKVPTGVAIASFGLAGLSWAPFIPVSVALFQRAATSAELADILATNRAAQVLCGPLGTMLAGPLIDAVGGRGTLLISAVSVLALSAITGCTLLPIKGLRRDPGQESPEGEML
jgi:MFS family permease